MYLRPLLCLICVFMLVNIADAAPFAYITNAGTGVGVDSVSIIDTSNNSIVKTVPIENGGDSAHPYGVAVSKAGDRVYISNQLSKTITVIDSSRSDYTVIATISRSYIPSGLAVNPAGSRLYVANEDNASVSIIDTTTPSYTEVGSVTVANSPAGIAVNSDGSKVYVANEGSLSVSVIDAGAGGLGPYSKTTDVTVGDSPKGIAFNAVNNTFYVANFGGNSVSAILASNNDVTTIDLVDSNAWPVGVAVNGDGSKVYVAKSGSDKVAVINSASNTLAGTPTITTAQAPYGVAVNVGGNGQVYVANSIDSAANGTVTAYNATTGALAATVQVNKRPQAFGNFIGPMMYPITLSVTGCGSISPVAGTDGKFWVAKDLSQTFAINPDSGCARSAVTLDGVSVGTPATQPVTGDAPHALAATFARDGWSVTVSKTGAGTGTVTCSSSDPYVPQTDISCGSTCTTVYKFASTVTCVATPDGAFTGSWTACPATPTGNTCAFTMPGAGGPAPATLVASFITAGGDVKIGENFYATIATAYDAAASTNIIKVKNATLKTSFEYLDLAHSAAFDRNISIVLEGGYDATLDTGAGTANPATPSRVGSIEISNGTVEIKNIVVQP